MDENAVTVESIQAYLKYRLDRAENRYAGNAVAEASDLRSAIQTVLNFPHVAASAAKILEEETDAK